MAKPLLFSKNLGKSGFVTTFFATTILTLIVSVLLFLGTSQVLDKISLGRSVCRQQLLSAQNRAASAIEKLLLINPQVQLLYTRWTTLRASQAAAIQALQFELLPALEKQIRIVERAQAQVGKLQKQTLKAGEAQLKTDVLRGQLELQQTLMVDFRKTQKPWRVELLNINRSQSRLAVREVQMPEGPPVYELENQFSAKQAVSINWMIKLHFLGGFSEWSIQGLKKSDACTGTLSEELKPTFQMGRY